METPVLVRVVEESLLILEPLHVDSSQSLKSHPLRKLLGPSVLEDLLLEQGEPLEEKH